MIERGGFEALDACVHCGFCLQACPTFLATGDEADSPRGRIELMRALEAGELGPEDRSLTLHLDRCLGCRGCEPVCPSGVVYGHGLEAAREQIARARGVPRLARAALWALTTPGVSRVVYALARLLRATGLPRRLAGWGRFRFALGMLAATRPSRKGTDRDGRRRSAPPAASDAVRPSPAPSVLLFRGCIMDGLFAHVHAAPIRPLAVNGYEVRRLASANVLAFGEGEEPIVVNSAGCGAILKDYGHLVGDARAHALAARVRDVTELLADRGPRPGAPLDRRVAYDPPCHLLHAQRVAEAPQRLLGAIPVLQLVATPDAAQCCGSAGLFTLVEPAMSRAVLAPKLATLREAAPQVVATGNPGCLMQLGAGLAAAGIAAAARHPVELLDESYRAAGYYA